MAPDGDERRAVPDRRTGQERRRGRRPLTPGETTITATTRLSVATFDRLCASASRARKPVAQQHRELLELALRAEARTAEFVAQVHAEDELRPRKSEDP